MEEIKRYGEMKDSGVEWIGEVPEHWCITFLKNVATIQTGSTPPKGQQDVYYASQGIMWVKPDNLGSLNPIQKTSEYLTPLGESIARITSPFSVLVCCIGSIGKVGYCSDRCAYNQQINALVFNNKMYWKYGLYLTFAQEDQYWCYANGNVLKIINSSSQGALKIPHPPIKEQQAIASYLDDKCSAIDDIIASSRASIEDYKQLKASTIYEAVTKGLNPDVEMKDSGVVFYGQIPIEWSVTKTLNVLSMPITDGPHTTPVLYDYGIPFLSAESVKNGVLDFNHMRGYISQDFYNECCKKYIPKRNDIYMVKSGATTGNVAIVETDDIFTIWSPLAVFRANSRVNYKFLYYIIQSDGYQRQVQTRWSYGTQQNIGMRVLET